jgi:hypothetical protein
MLLLVLVGVLLALHLRAVGDEVAGVSVVEATLLLSTMLAGLAIIVEPVDQHTRSSSPSTLTYSSVIGIKEDKANKADEGLAEDPPRPDTRAMDGFVGFSILALDCWSISVDLSFVEKLIDCESLIVWVLSDYINFDIPNPLI